MVLYSAIKINATPPLKYSILNPDTNSDSPSIKKSIGLRFSPANILIQNVIVKGINLNVYHTYNCHFNKITK